MAEIQRESEATLITRLRNGDEAAFGSLVDDLHGRLIGVARTFTSSPALAEDIVQETWLGVVRGLRGFEGRSSLRTWIFSILVRRARTMASREARRAEVPLPPRVDGGDSEAGEWVPGAGKIGLWKEAPVPWGLQDPAALLQSKEALEVIRRALEALPASQRQVVLLRDVEDVPARDICNILEVSETNLRVLLHRGRARIRQALDVYLRGDTARPGPARPQPGAARPKVARPGQPPGGPGTTGETT